MSVNGIFGTSIELLGKSLDLRTRSHNLISGNLANAETPGYTPTTLSFEGELRDAMRQKKTPAATNPRHIPLKGQADSLQQVTGTQKTAADGTVGRDGNGVELESEMSRMMENQIMYNASVQLLAKKFEGLKYAVKGQ